MTIPPTLHFLWIGPALPWAYAFAVLTAAERSGLDDIVLHHTDALDDSAPVRALRDAPRIRLARLDAHGLLRGTGQALGLGDALAALHDRLADPVKRSDVLRAAILHGEGGIYADLDTVTVASLRPLLGARAFVGTESIVWPRATRAARSPLRKARPVALDLTRKLLRALPHGWKAFRRVEHLYARGVNNAVIGAAPGAALTAAYIRAMAALPRARQDAPYGLGPHLLADIVGGMAETDVAVHPPAVFYPLAPEISEHWFRPVRRVDLDAVLPPATRLVHWYASVRTRGRVAAIDPGTVARDRGRQPYSALVWSCLPAAVRRG